MILKTEAFAGGLLKVLTCLLIFFFCNPGLVVHASVMAGNGEIAGRCFEDLNGNGVPDPGEKGLPDVEVIIGRYVAGIFLVSVRITQTDNDGAYGFEDLKPGFYRIQGLEPDGYDLVTQDSMMIFIRPFSGPREVYFGFRAADRKQVPEVSVWIDADPEVIARGEPATLTWASENADEVFIDNGIGLVDPEGSLRTFPDRTVTYTITATGPYGEATDTVQVGVEDPQDLPVPPYDAGSDKSTSSTSSSTTTTTPGSSETTTTTAVQSSTTSTFDDSHAGSSTTSVQDALPPAPATGLIAAPGDCKVGLAWKNPEDDLWEATRVLRKAGAEPAGSSDGVLVYDGRDSDFVDSGLESGVTYYYRAFSYASGPVFSRASDAPYASATPYSMSEDKWLSDWKNNPDPFADEVVEFDLAMNSDTTPHGLPDIVLGPPHGGGEAGNSVDVFSLGCRVNDDDGASLPYGGSIVLEFTDNIVVNGQGPDFTVFENAFAFNYGGRTGRFMEPAVVSVSQDGETFYRFPCDFVPLEKEDPDMTDIIMHCSDPDNYPAGFAGINPVTACFDNETKSMNVDPTDPSVSGGDCFDLDDLEGVSLKWIRYVKIQSTGDMWMEDSDGDLIRHTPETGACSGAGFSGFDLDAVSAVNY